MSSLVTRRRMLGGGIAVCGMCALPGELRVSNALALEDAPVEDGEIVFKVMRKGGKIGEHAVSFTRAADGALRAVTEIEVTPRVLGVTVYRYEQSCEEIWRGGRLVSLSSRTNDNGKKYALTGTREGGTFHVERENGETRTLSGDVLTSTLWHPRTPRAESLLDIKNAKIREINGELLGLETISVPGGSLEAEHYRLRGDLSRELWYDNRGRLVRISVETKRDSAPLKLEPIALKG